ncbi:hypothetical protein COEREDRAFT_90817 [Coemansia reversa NRRL 1564]|uniref:Metallothionein n=1 Tax=Coemansia reversa (strain ATCC 12441 / NRRL 1564) TaxID=763665 RepID=A0A2G5BIT1_COERN|nr:hypothetical protein COEREDRAFT_90817 [Coemansia reversa NRRL 1564]|eukprot:PIA18882.1 hypothetical protein COEREDRAFT_90817 [Coemansia reversa NRRL 1564]
MKTFSLIATICAVAVVAVSASPAESNLDKCIAENGGKEFTFQGEGNCHGAPCECNDDGSTSCRC